MLQQLYIRIKNSFAQERSGELRLWIRFWYVGVCCCIVAGRHVVWDQVLSTLKEMTIISSFTLAIAYDMKGIDIGKRMIVWCSVGMDYTWWLNVQWHQLCSSSFRHHVITRYSTLGILPRQDTYWSTHHIQFPQYEQWDHCTCNHTSTSLWSAWYGNSHSHSLFSIDNPHFRLTFILRRKQPQQCRNGTPWVLCDKGVYYG